MSEMTDDLNEQARTRVRRGYRPPPPGWFPFGHHVDVSGPLEFSEETDEALMPLWERPWRPARRRGLAAAAVTPLHMTGLVSPPLGSTG